MARKIKIKRTKNKQAIILQELTTIQEYETIEGNHFKAKAYQKAIKAIQKINSPIQKIEDLENVSGIGKSIHEKIQEIISTGKSKKAESIKKDPDFYFIKELTNYVYGIGPKKAKELVKKNKIKTIEELDKRKGEIQPNKRPLLNNKQVKGLLYFQDLHHRIPRKEMDRFASEIDTIIKTNFDESIHYIIAGSYRRGESSSGDIDILITSDLKDSSVLKQLVSLLKKNNLICDDLVMGSKKYHGIAKLSGKNMKNRRLDIMYTDPEEYGFAKMYFTGSGEFNVMMREIVSKKKLRLNEYGIYEKQTKIDIPHKHTVVEEQDIFNYLNIPYVEPKNRNATVLKPYLN